jgi:hypothetical protein
VIPAVNVGFSDWMQCTVTRPGLSFITAGLAVELMVALLQSPHRQRHPSEMVSGSSSDEGANPVPHQMRGSLKEFVQFSPAVSYILYSRYPIQS